MRKERAVRSQEGMGNYRSTSCGLYPDDFAKIEALAIEADLSNSTFLRQLVHDALANIEAPKSS